MKQLPLIILLAITFLTGCNSGPSDLPELGTVKGNVTLDGKPLANATVIFKNIDKENFKTSSATTDKDGNYELRFSGSNLGATLGNNLVTVEIGEGYVPEIPAGVDVDKLSPEEKKKLYQADVPKIPEKYNTQSTLKVEVKPGANTIDLPLTSK